MRLLHIGDLHFRTNSGYTQERIIKAFLDTIQKETTVDFILFSGDLVNNGSILKDFAGAKEYFIDPLLRSLNKTTDQFFICEGNHDIDRGKCVQAVVKDFNESYYSKKDIEGWFEKKMLTEQPRRDHLITILNF